MPTSSANASGPRTATRRRIARAEETTRSYLGAIYDIERATNADAQVKDIAERLKVTHPAVTKILSKLKADGLVEGDRYKPVRLTDAGRRLAKEDKGKRDTIRRFLAAAGMAPADADEAAAGLEHHANAKVVDLMRRMARLLRTEGRITPELLEESAKAEAFAG